MMSRDIQKEMETIKAQLAQYRHEIDMDQNKHVKSMFDGFKQETQNLLKQVQSCED
jgi:t-SNARE complex subunit (syntaxin)